MCAFFMTDMHAAILSAVKTLTNAGTEEQTPWRESTRWRERVGEKEWREWVGGKDNAGNIWRGMAGKGWWEIAANSGEGDGIKLWS